MSDGENTSRGRACCLRGTGHAMEQDLSLVHGQCLSDKVVQTAPCFGGGLIFLVVELLRLAARLC